MSLGISVFFGGCFLNNVFLYKKNFIERISDKVRNRKCSKLNYRCYSENIIMMGSSNLLEKNRRNK